MPANNSTSAAPWGVGIELPGVYGDLVLNNEIKNNPSDGVLAFEALADGLPESASLRHALDGVDRKDNL